MIASQWSELAVHDRDSSCHQWTAVGVSSDTLGGVNINWTTWEQSCQVHDMDIRQLDTQHMLTDRHGKYIDNNRVPSCM